MFKACELDHFLNESRKKIHHHLVDKPQINQLEDISSFSFNPELYLLGINTLIKGANKRISSMWQKRVLLILDKMRLRINALEKKLGMCGDDL